MAGTIRADIIQSELGTPTVFRNGSGTEIGTLSRSWLNYNGITPATRASFNVSSVTKNGAGDYTINFTNSLLDVNYTCAGLFGNGNGYLARTYDDVTARTVLLFRIACFNLAGATQDAAFVQITNNR